ncbi:MAG TPA: hypothetical protein PLZ81_03830 [Acidiphilium rubrum]|nr:hypothetical protein [Acidiphilium sp.]HQT83975.1 hypothetical protein [Acidiphilium rubrum]
MVQPVAIANLMDRAADLQPLLAMAMAMICDCDDRVDVFGAISVGCGVGLAIIMPGMNTEAMNEHRAEISTQVAAGADGLLVCDGVGSRQTDERRSVAETIMILTLPPHAARLNPVETVWDDLRGNNSASLVWDRHASVLEVCEQAGLVLVNEPAGSASIGMRASAYVKG